MALYHCTVKIISRANGRTSTACAAYRAGDVITDERTGITSDFRRKGGVSYSEINLPENAPDRYKDRSTLWNSVEIFETRKDAQVAREVEISLPKESELKEQVSMVREFVKCSFVDNGMIADWSIHDKGDGNPHAHIMLTTRPLKSDGSWGIKERSTYALDAEGNKIPKIDPATGEQMLRYRDGRNPEPVWIRNNVQTTNWNDRDLVEVWRHDWCEIENRWLVDHDLDPVTHESFERQGITDIEPTIHEGVAARQLEARGEYSERMEINRDIMAHRDIVDAMKDVTRELTEAYIDKVEQSFNDMESQIKKEDSIESGRDADKDIRAFREGRADVEGSEDERRNDIESPERERISGRENKEIGTDIIEERITDIRDDIDSRKIEQGEFRLDGTDSADIERSEDLGIDRREEEEPDPDRSGDRVGIDESDLEWEDCYDDESDLGSKD